MLRHSVMVMTSLYQCLLLIFKSKSTTTSSCILYNIPYVLVACIMFHKITHVVHFNIRIAKAC